PGEVPDLALALRSPVAAVEAQDQREFARQRRKPHGLLLVIGQLEIGETATDGEITSHGASSAFSAGPRRPARSSPPGRRATPPGRARPRRTSPRRPRG